MFKLFIIIPLVLFSTNFADASSTKSIMAQFFGQSKDIFKVSGCPKFALNPTDLFSLLTYKTSFAKNCDAEGTVAIKLLSEFPISLKLRNLADYKQITGTAKINLGMETPPRILAELKNSTLTGKKNIYFNAFYSGEVEPAKTIKIKQGTETIKIEIMNSTFTKKIEEYSFKLK